MRIFVTGVRSFIGGALLRACARRDIAVSGIDLAEPVPAGCAVADLCDPSLAAHIPEGVDAVVHLAAISRDPDCRADPERCFRVNVLGTLNLLRCASMRAARQLIFASTEWVYDSFSPDRAKTEEDPIDPSRLASEYALSKLVSECNLRQAFSREPLPTTVLRFGIVYGPRDGNFSAAESLLVAVARQDEVRVGSLATARCFIHVDDIADGILASIGAQGFEVINLQGPRPVTLGAVIESAQRITGRAPRIVETGGPGSASIRLVAGEKAARILGWRARIEIEEGLASVARHLALV